MAFNRDEAEYNRRYGKPTSYRLPIKLRTRIKEIAQSEGMGLSALVCYVLALFVVAYEGGTIKLPEGLHDEG